MAPYRTAPLGLLNPYGGETWHFGPGRGMTFNSALGQLTFTVYGLHPPITDAVIMWAAVSKVDVDDFYSGRPMRPSYTRRYEKLRAQYARPEDGK